MFRKGLFLSLVISGFLLLNGYAFAMDSSGEYNGIVVSTLLDKAEPVTCSDGTISPIVISGTPCPGGVYCEYYRRGQTLCCPQGYFYFNPCTCKCYKTSYDAGSDL